MFKKRSASKNLRKPLKQDSDSDDSEEERPTTMNPSKKIKINSSSSKKSITSTNSTLKATFDTSGTAASLHTDTATRTLDVDGHSKEGTILNADDLESGLYKGLNQYKEYVNKKVENVTQTNAGGLRAGPLKGQSNVRISCRFDYAPDVCKDYKDSGFCGYGDSCKFMHDRGDYKSGWELEREWEAERKAKAIEKEATFWIKGNKDEKDEEEQDEDDFPTICLICEKEFTNPVVTKCEHYFCEACAIKNFATSPKCFACEQFTSGVFNVAKELKLKIKKKKEFENEKIKNTNDDIDVVVAVE